MSSADEERHRNLGVLYTAYLDKRNPINGRYKKRFVVLTHEAIHWFQRSEGYDLFGAERGNVSLGGILSTRILDNDSNVFEIHGTDTKKRLFRATTPLVCEEWVSAIRSAVKSFTDKQRVKGNNKRPSLSRRSTLSNIKFDFNEVTENPADNEISVQMVSIFSSLKRVEFIVARSPVFDHIISIPEVYEGDKLLLSLSNGGSVSFSYDDLIRRSDSLIEFEMAVQNVALASSLKLLFERENTKATGSGGSSRANHQWVNQLSMALDDRNKAVSLILAMGVIVLFFSSFKSVDGENFLLFLFAFTLAIYQLVQVAKSSKTAKKIESSGSYEQIIQGGLSVRLTILSHSFTSPDKPLEDSDEIPERFIKGCDNDLKEATRRWDITQHWRESEQVDKVLFEKQPNFNIIKSMYPHYHAGRGKDGHVIFYEREGHIEVDQLAARDVKVPEMLKHWIFVTEYHWEVVCGGDPLAKSISVMDLDRLQLRDLAGTNLEYVKAAMGYANQHYPERSHIVFIVNAPWYFSVGWKMVKGWVHPNTQKKINILSPSETLSGLQKHIDISQIPVYYGGELDYSDGKDPDSCRFSDPVNVALQEYVDRLNRGEVPPERLLTSHKSPGAYASAGTGASSGIDQKTSYQLLDHSTSSDTSNNSSFEMASPSDDIMSIQSSAFSINSSNTSRSHSRGSVNHGVTFATDPQGPPLASPALSHRSISSLGMTPN